jgi:hypothetical protein
MLLFELRFVHVPFSRCEMAVPAAGGVDLSRKFVSETEIEEKRKQRQEEWEKVRQPEDPESKPSATPLYLPECTQTQAISFIMPVHMSPLSICIALVSV